MYGHIHIILIHTHTYIRLTCGLPIVEFFPYNFHPGPSTKYTQVRGIMDRYDERRALLRTELSSIDADVFAFQEILTGEFAQERHMLGGDYSVFGCRYNTHALFSPSSPCFHKPCIYMHECA